MRNYRNYTDNDIRNAASISKSVAGTLRVLGLKPMGGNFYTMKKHLQRLSINTEHWNGTAWSRGQQLKDWSKYKKPASTKPHLINERGHKCEECGRRTWRQQSIPLEAHHKDGNRTNNAYDNLQLLCPNCHALTDNWRRRGNK